MTRPAAPAPPSLGDIDVWAPPAARHPLRRPGADLDRRQTVRVRLVGGFELTQGGRPVALPLTAQRVIAFLALHDRPLLRGFVSGCLYTEKSEERAQGNLRSALWRTRQTGLDAVHATGNHLSLRQHVRVDVRESIARARRLIDAGARVDDDDLDDTLLVNDLLPDWYDDWVLFERERLRQLRLHALEALCMRLTAAGRLAQAVDVGIAMTAAEPLRESAHRVLIEAHLAEGNAVEALRHYRTFAEALWREAGLEPSRRLQDLVAGSRRVVGPPARTTQQQLDH
jgi:DNA-binding SARP family transcriptional activator